ncbi:MAG: hypothetical protein HS124_08450 [Anaerolineales bacterium]|nr:hypothetical protein [Anaerolineales bacterium]
MRSCRIELICSTMLLVGVEGRSAFLGVGFSTGRGVGRGGRGVGCGGGSGCWMGAGEGVIGDAALTSALISGAV